MATDYYYYYSYYFYYYFYYYSSYLLPLLLRTQENYHIFIGIRKLFVGLFQRRTQHWKRQVKSLRTLMEI